MRVAVCLLETQLSNKTPVIWFGCCFLFDRTRASTEEWKKLHVDGALSVAQFIFQSLVVRLASTRADSQNLELSWSTASFHESRGLPQQIAQQHASGMKVCRVAKVHARRPQVGAEGFVLSEGQEGGSLLPRVNRRSCSGMPSSPDVVFGTGPRFTSAAFRETQPDQREPGQRCCPARKLNIYRLFCLFSYASVPVGPLSVLQDQQW